MTQNLYAGEGNDRGWYRVNRENKKLKREVERLSKALKLARVYIINEQIIGSGRTIDQIDKALKGGSK